MKKRRPIRRHRPRTRSAKAFELRARRYGRFLDRFFLWQREQRRAATRLQQELLELAFGPNETKP